MSKPIDENKIVVITGAGVSAESGLATFRDSNGMWNNYSISEVATPGAWRNTPDLVLDFYNMRRAQAAESKPNAAHFAIAKLEEKFDVVVITQNVDALHERAGSSNVIHVHGELTKARSSKNPDSVVDIGNKSINIGDLATDGSQLRPHIVWFGEEILSHEESVSHIKTAGKVLVIGTSLTVYPAAGMLKKARHRADKLIISLDIEKRPFGYTFLRGTAVGLVPPIVDGWLEGQKFTKM